MKAGKFLFGAALAGVLMFGCSLTPSLSAGAEDAATAKKEPVSYYLTDTVRQNLETNGMTYSDGNYFNGIRWENTTGNPGTADSEWWGFATVWMGLTDGSGAVDLTEYDSVNLETYGVTLDANWLTVHLVDENGTLLCANTDYGTESNKNDYRTLFDGMNTAGEILTDYANPSSDWRGVFVGYQIGEVKFTRDSFKNGEVNSITEPASEFDWTKVVAMGVRYHSWDAKTTETGKVTLVKGESRTVAFDPAKATLNKTWMNRDALKTIKNDTWYYGPAWWRMNEDHTYEDFIGENGLKTASIRYNEQHDPLNTDKAVWDLYKTKNANDTWAQAMEWDEKNDRPAAKYTDISAYKGIKFELDTTDVASDYVQIDFTFKLIIDGRERFFKGFGNKVSAIYISEDGTVLKIADLKKGSNWIPKDFKGTVYFPFGAFEDGEDKLNDVADFGKYIAEIHNIVVNQTWAVDDHAVLSNMQAYDCVEHTDNNHDQLCDYCAAEVPCTHVDEDHDQKCDWCEEDVPCTNHKDDNKDGKCDYCGEDLGTSSGNSGSDSNTGSNNGGVSSDSGCGSVIGGISMGALTLAGVVLCVKKRKIK